jgi:hypothetical protein
MIKLISKYSVVLLMIGFLFTRLFLLNDVPYGLHVDEAGMAYDAYSLAHFGVDRYLNSYPIYLINFGGGQSALYAYSVAFLLKFFDYSTFIIRLPGVILSTLTFIIGYLTISEILHSKKFGLLFSFLFTILPYYIMQSRFGLDCNLMMGMSSIVLYFVHKMIMNPSPKSYFIAGLFSGLILYTYALSYVVMPIFLFLVLLIMLVTKKLVLKHSPYFIIPLFILALPLLVMVMINTFDYNQINILGFTIPKLPRYRGSGFTLSNISFNLKYVIKSVFMYDQLTYNTFIRFYTLYKISIPFAILGIIKGFIDLIKSIRFRQYNPIVLFWLFALSEFILGLIMIEQPNANKLNGIFYSILVLTVYGIYWINEYLNNWIKTKLIIRFLQISLIAFYSFNFISFAMYYFTEYKYDIYPQTLFTHTYSDELEYIHSNNIKNITVYTENNIHSNYQGDIYYRLSDKVSPYDYNQFVSEDGYKNIVFGLPDTIEKNAYYIVLKINTAFLELMDNDLFNRIEFNDYYVFEPITN